MWEMQPRAIYSDLEVLSFAGIACGLESGNTGYSVHLGSLMPLLELTF
jgi:hypothetical protein